MKRLLLVLVLTTACVGILATPALAQPQLQDGVYMWIYDGSWFQVAGGQQVAFGDPGSPIPADQPVWLATAWAAYGRGHIQSIPSAIVETLNIGGKAVVAGTAASKALWSVPYTSVALAKTVPFNPRMRISGWVAFWLYQVRPGLPAGTYMVSGTETYTHLITDLAYVAENHPGPFFYPAGTNPFGPWELVLP